MELVGNDTPDIEDNVQPCEPHCPLSWRPRKENVMLKPSFLEM